jgi:hypothetical protein
MNYPNENDVKKVSALFRLLAAFIILCSLLAGVGLVFAFMTEPPEPVLLIGVAVIGILLHVSGSVVFTGYAPKYLLFAHGTKRST